MNKLAALPILIMLIGGAAVAYGVVGSLSHLSTGHVTITEPEEPTLSGNFTVPASITFPNTHRGASSTVTIQVTSTLNAAVTLTATSPGVDGVTVTAGPITLNPDTTIDVTLTLHASDQATLGALSIPITFTVEA